MKLPSIRLEINELFSVRGGFKSAGEIELEVRMRINGADYSVRDIVRGRVEGEPYYRQYTPEPRALAPDSPEKRLCGLVSGMLAIRDETSDPQTHAVINALLRIHAPNETKALEEQFAIMKAHLDAAHGKGAKGN